MKKNKKLREAQNKYSREKTTLLKVRKEIYPRLRTQADMYGISINDWLKIMLDFVETHPINVITIE